MAFAQFHQTCLSRFDGVLRTYQTSPMPKAERLMNAMQYSLLNGGKRVRPMLVYASAQALGANLNLSDTPALAIEMMHAYSLVHDDLPAMDDDDLRRGKPTCHIAFDEATAILAGDALQTEAFSLLSQPQSPLSPVQQLNMVQLLSQASGVFGMAGGQSLDLEAVNRQVDIHYLEVMHQHKTGALIEASVLLGAHCAEQVSPLQLEQLSQYAKAIGLAFQVQDDILDVISDTQTLGKTQGADAALNKPTYVSLLGLEGAQLKAQQLHGLAMAAIQEWDVRAQPLRDIADYIVNRSN